MAVDGDGDGDRWPVTGDCPLPSLLTVPRAVGPFPRGTNSRRESRFNGLKKKRKKKKKKKEKKRIASTSMKIM